MPTDLEQAMREGKPYLIYDRRAETVARMRRGLEEYLATDPAPIGKKLRRLTASVHVDRLVTRRKSDVDDQNGIS